MFAKGQSIGVVLESPDTREGTARMNLTLSRNFSKSEALAKLRLTATLLGLKLKLSKKR